MERESKHLRRASLPSPSDKLVDETNHFEAFMYCQIQDAKKLGGLSGGEGSNMPANFATCQFRKVCRPNIKVRTGNIETQSW